MAQKAGYRTPCYLTFRQAAELGGHVRKGEYGTKSTFREAAAIPGHTIDDDYVSLPSFATFKSAAHFYGVAFHELGHWTGHKSRLNRNLKHRFGERAYAAEELIAELCVTFLRVEFSIDGACGMRASRPGLGS
jgi:antirestriction protein ArdC